MQIGNKVASFDVDAQNTFTPLCPNELPVPGGTEIVEELNAQARYAEYRLGSKEGHNPKAVWVATADHPQLESVAGPNVDVRWNLHAVPGTLGFELIDGLPHPAEYDFFVWKGIELDMHPFGSCYHDLAEKQALVLSNTCVATRSKRSLSADSPPITALKSPRYSCAAPVLQFS